jgi:aconitate hydratase 2/2-methylisocitrate dehydratase
VLWFFGKDLPGVTNKRGGGICIGSKVGPIFYNPMEGAGALVFEADVEKMNVGDVIDIFLLVGNITNADTGKVLAEYAYRYSPWYLL